MKLMNSLLVVHDIDKSVDFYKKVLGLRVVMDFGANKTLTCGLCLQTLETYKGFIGADEITFAVMTQKFILRKTISIHLSRDL